MRADGDSVEVGVQAVYDAVASAYDRQLGDELDHKPLDRALLTGFAEMAGHRPGTGARAGVRGGIDARSVGG